MRDARIAPPSEHRDPVQINGLGADKGPVLMIRHHRSPNRLLRGVRAARSAGRERQDDRERPFSMARSGRGKPSGPLRR